MIVERKKSRTCKNCIYSVFCNERWLCIKQGMTVKDDDLCDYNIRRFVVMYEEVNLYDTVKISMDEVDSEVQQVDVPSHMSDMPLPQ